MNSSRIVDPRIEADAFAGDSRSDARRAERVKEDALARLASDLCELSAKKLGQLELREELAQAVSEGRAISASSARNRQMRRIRVLLREHDWVQLRTQLDTLLETGVVPGLGTTPADPVSDASLTWTLRLVGEGHAGVEAFVAELSARRPARICGSAGPRGKQRPRASSTSALNERWTAALRGFLR